MRRTSTSAVKTASDFAFTGANAAALTVLAPMHTWGSSIMSSNAEDIAVKIALGVLCAAAIHKTISTVANRAELDTSSKKVQAGLGLVSKTAFMSAFGVSVYTMATAQSLSTQQTLFLSSMLAGFSLLVAEQVPTLARADEDRAEIKMAGFTLGAALAALNFAGITLYDTVTAGSEQPSSNLMQQFAAGAGTAAALGFAALAGKAVYDIYKAYQANKAANTGELKDPLVTDALGDGIEEGSRPPSPTFGGSDTKVN